MHPPLYLSYAMLLLTPKQVCERVIRGVERDAGDPSNANCEVAKLLINKVRCWRCISGPSVASWQESVCGLGWRCISGPSVA
jgi:hypothetical protein